MRSCQSDLTQLRELAGEATARLDDVSAATSNDYPYGPFGVKQRDRYVDSSDRALRELMQK